MASTTETTFVRRVRQELEHQRLSVRGLAKRIDPNNVERARRNLHRWLDAGITPSVQGRGEVADALGITPAELVGGDDEEEPSDMVGVLLHRVADVVLSDPNVRETLRKLVTA